MRKNRLIITSAPRCFGSFNTQYALSGELRCSSCSHKWECQQEVAQREKHKKVFGE